MSSKTKDMTTGSSMLLLVQFFIPLFAGNLFQQLYSFVDSVIVGKGIGDAALAAVGNTGGVHWLIFGFAIGLTGGLGIYISQAFGSGDIPQLRRVVSMSTFVCLITGILLTTISLLGMRSLFRFLNTPEDMMKDTLDYFRIILIGCSVSIFNNFAMTLLRSVGNSRIPLVSMIFSSFINIILDLVFVIPLKMNVSGAALATVLSQIFSVIYCFLHILKIPELIPEKTHWRLDLSLILKLFGKGLPVALMNSITSLGGLAVQYFINTMGTMAIAAQSACMKLCSLFEQAGGTIGLTVLTYVGQNYGAGKFDRIQLGVHQALLLTVLVNIPIALVQILIPAQLTSLMLSDPTIIGYTKDFLHITAFAFFPLGFLFVYRNASQGMGHTLVPMFSGVLEVAMRVLFAFLLVRPMGIRGAAIAEISAWIAAAIMLAITYYVYYHIEKKKALT